MTGVQHELFWPMERAVVTAVSASASTAAAFVRSRAQLSADRSDDLVFSSSRLERATVLDTYDEIAYAAMFVRAQARWALSVGQDDPQFWYVASDQTLIERVRWLHGADPAMIGDRDHDRRWLAAVDVRELVATYVSATRWSHACPSAGQMVTNIAEFLAEHHLNIDTLLDASSAEGARILRAVQPNAPAA